MAMEQQQAPAWKGTAEGQGRSSCREGTGTGSGLAWEGGKGSHEKTETENGGRRAEGTVGTGEMGHLKAKVRWEAKLVLQKETSKCQRLVWAGY